MFAQIEEVMPMSDEQPKTLESAIDGMPWWVKTGMLFANTFGFPILMVAYLLAQDAGVIRNPVADKAESIDKTLQELKGTMIQHDASMREIVNAMEEEARTRQMRCVLRAKTEADKKACFPAENGGSR